MESETGKTGLVISKNKDEMSAGVSCFKDSTTIVSRTLLLLREFVESINVHKNRSQKPGSTTETDRILTQKKQTNKQKPDEAYLRWFWNANALVTGNPPPRGNVGH